MREIAPLDDREYVADQYQTATNLNARIFLHQGFSTNKYGWYPWVFDRLCFPPQARILELACGPGGLWLENMDRIPAGWQITLSDLSVGMVQQAYRRLELGRHRFQFAVMDAQSIPCQSQSLDGVVGNHMLYHVPRRDQALSEIHRVLRPGGRCYIATNGQAHLREIALLVARFDPGLSTWGERPTDPFTLENGAAQLARWFAEVTLTRYQDALVVTEPAVLVDYILSGRIGLADEERPALRAFVEEEFRKQNGQFYISKDSGIFAVRNTPQT